MFIHTYFLFLWLCDPTRTAGFSFMRFPDHTQRRTTVSKDSSGRVINPTQRLLHDHTQQTQQENTHGPGGIRNRYLSRPAAADLHLRPRGSAKFTCYTL